MPEKYPRSLIDYLGKTVKLANAILTLDADPGISPADKKIMFENGCKQIDTLMKEVDILKAAYYSSHP